MKENRIKLYGAKYNVTTAGPSPGSNYRTELFFFGCKLAMSGNACEGCFNSQIWDNSIAIKDYSPQEIVDTIKENAENKYITIGGGEPTDQLEGLIELTKLLKAEGFHILLYSWKTIDMLPEELLINIDILVDGKFLKEERLYDTNLENGLANSVGSGNQRVWDLSLREGYCMKDLDCLALDDTKRLIYFLKDINKLPEKYLKEGKIK